MLPAMLADLGQNRPRPPTTASSPGFEREARSLLDLRVSIAYLRSGLLAGAPDTAALELTGVRYACPSSTSAFREAGVGGGGECAPHYGRDGLVRSALQVRVKRSPVVMDTRPHAHACHSRGHPHPNRQRRGGIGGAAVASKWKLRSVAIVTPRCGRRWHCCLLVWRGHPCVV